MTFRRVVVALGESSPAAMAKAVELALSLETELLGLFVEDIELFNLAALPFASEIGFPSAVRRTLDVDAVERSFRAQARQLRQDLAMQLAGAPLKWTFEVVRGRIAAELQATTEKRDLVIVPALLAAPGRIAARARVARAFRGLRAPLLLVGESRRSGDAIGVVASADVDPIDIAEIVGALAPHYGRSVLFIPVGAAPQQWESWQDTMRGLLAGLGISGRFSTVADAAPIELDRVIVGQARKLVVMLVRAPESRDVLLEALSFPLLLLPERNARSRRNGR